MPYQRDKNGKKRKVRRLVDVDVSHVSLVDNPANRTPFKFIKSDHKERDSQMNITLKNMFGSRTPAVTSVMADTQAKAIAVAKMLMDANEVELSEQNGIHIARAKGEDAPANEQIVHLGKSTGIAYGVSHLQKELALYDIETENFDEAVKQEGFVPGLMIGMEALHSTIRNIAMSTDTSSADAFRSGVRNAVEDFADYVDSLIGALPEKAFKFEKALSVITPTGPVHITPEGFNAEVYDAVFGDEQPETSKTMEEAAAPEAEEAPKAEATEAEAAPAAEAEEPKEEAQAAADDGMPPKPDNLDELPAGERGPTAADIEKMFENMVAGLTKTVEDKLDAAVKPLAAKAEATDAALDKLTKAVGGTIATTPDADSDNVVTLQKGEQGASGGDGYIPLIDTAYNVKRG